jgi:hypothetical protein
VHRTFVYADCSVFGGTEDDDFAEASRRFFDLVVEGRYLVLVSQLVLEELERAPDKVRGVLAGLPPGSVLEVPVDGEVTELAQAYVDAGVLGSRSLADALHVAAATVARADLILSWNFRHLVNFDRVRKFNGVNALNGYPRIEIRSPLEVGYADEGQDV